LKCQYCENNVDLPFRCPFCSGYFCPDHRLPENHTCPELLKVRTRTPATKEEYLPPATEGKPETPRHETLLTYPFWFRKPGWTSSTEAVHLTIGALIVMGVGLSLHEPIFSWVFSLYREPIIFLSLALIFTFIFFIHELAHKAAAKHYGLWAEFRLSLLGVLLTLLSLAPTPLKFVSPGAVIIAGAGDKRIIGITALAGPLTSIALTSLFFFLYFLVPYDPLALVMLKGAMLGAWLALLNLIPFGILDGAKVYWWNRTVWAVSFVSSIVLGLAILRFVLY